MKATLLKPRLLMALAATAAAMLATVATWSQLVSQHERDLADVAESVSYATRSELVRRLETQFSALRRVALYWATFADGSKRDVPRLATDAKIELDHFEGIEFIAWRHPSGRLRFFTEASSLDLTRTPTEAEWRRVLRSLQAVGGLEREALIGPAVDERGAARYLFYVPVAMSGGRADLISSIDITANLEALLRDEAPGYAIRVSCCDGTELYRRGEAAVGLDESWSRKGWIRLSPGARWHVAHAPTQALMDNLDSWAFYATLLTGLIMSLLLGAFIHETLRARSRARAATAARDQTAQANAALESQVKARTQGLSDALSDLNTINLSVTHDLRSPLQAILLTVRGLEAEYREALGASGVERLRTIVTSSAYMNAVMDRLLSFSKASTFEYETGTVDMREAAQRVAAGLARSGPRGAQIVLGDLPPCQADATMVDILWTNLLDNALKHAGGAETARIELGHVTRGGETVYFVKDNGPGFDAADAERIFRPLERASKARGLGLGLAIVKRIVTRHGGRIWAESSPGRGATFYFTLSAPGS